MPMRKTISTLCLVLIALAACAPATGSTTEATATTETGPVEVTEEATQTIEQPGTGTAEPTTEETPLAVEWQSMPVVPEGLSPAMREVYQRGLERGRDPERFSKFGDCQNVPSRFLAMFDTGEYRLGDSYAYLQETIDHFSGSWSRESSAVLGGMNVASVQTLYFTDPQHCEVTESPMVCEIRVHNPSLVLISFETWFGKPASMAEDSKGSYEARLRAVVDYVLSQDVVPILGTKADNLEGDHSINAAIARVARDYQIPLWNYWAATDVLPSHGLSEDGFHLTFALNYFDDPARMEMAWPWRNLTALQTIDAVYRALQDLP